MSERKKFGNMSSSYINNQNYNKLPINSINLLVFETIKYIQNKKLTNREKLIEIDMFGQQLGEKVMNYLLVNLIKKDSLDKNNCINFISNEFWSFIFSKPVTKLSVSNNNKMFFFEVEEINIFIPLVSNKQQNNEEFSNFENILVFISGIIKGALKLFNIESIVVGSFKYDILYQSVINQVRADKYPFNFNINILSNDLLS